MPTTAERDFWDVPPLTADDQQLVNAYSEVGVAVDNLPYSEAMVRLVAKLGLANTDPEKSSIYHRLLTLRKRGRLPRIY